jgi:hypothetical protein
MLLKKRVAVIYDAHGAIGGVTKTFGREGAPGSIEPVGGSNQSRSSRIRSPPTASRQTPAQADVLDETAAEAQKLPVDNFLPLINLYLRTQSLRARPAAGRMAKAGSGESA